MADHEELPVEIDVATLASMLRESEDFLLLDVREEDEFATAHIEGSVLIPMSELSDRVGELEPHRDRRVVVHCHHGGRSMQVTQMLRGNGFPNVQNLAGGIDQWSQQIDPSVPRY